MKKLGLTALCCFFLLAPISLTGCGGSKEASMPDNVVADPPADDSAEEGAGNAEEEEG
ncbi:MAG: hypothetical protein VXZ82_00585 [Planctomycetota bacterium]|nr:hypothetical protein [Planctomycetota bacterium]